MSDELKKNILATVAYYDGLDYPLTSFEIWKYLLRVANDRQQEEGAERDFSMFDVIRELDSDSMKRHIEECKGFYLLKGRTALAEKRITNNKISARKIKRLRRVVWFLRFIPYVRMIGVTGRLAMKNATEGSDWDLLVVLKAGKIWTGRTLVTLATHLMGKRRYRGRIKDRVCLNYFITDESLEIATKDIFSSHEYFFMFPLFGKGTHERFQAKNKWIKKFRPIYSLTEIDNLKLMDSNKFSEAIKKIGELVLDSRALEDWLGKWQRAKIMKNPKTKKAGSLIQASRESLVFLPEPQGPKVFERFRKKIESLS